MGEQISYSISEAIEKKVSDVILKYYSKNEFNKILELPLDLKKKSEVVAYMARINALYMITRAGSGHIGSSFSSLDIVTFLHLGVLNKNDKYFSSKGHDSPGLYALHTAIGIVPFEKIHTLRRFGGLPGHPDIQTPGAFTNTGSLGMGVSKAKGFIVSDDLLNKYSKVFVLTGDGELQEGQFWESLTTLQYRFDDRIIVIIDHNKVQSDCLVSQVSDLGNLERKFESFGLDVYHIDGHDLNALANAIENKGNGKPKVIIADTVKGKGVSFMEHTVMQGNYYKYHSGAPSNEEYVLALNELLKFIDLFCVDNKIESPQLSEINFQPLSIKVGTTTRLIPSYSEALLEIAESNKKIICLDADLILDTGLIPFKEKYPDRFIECGIAEQDMVSQAGTMALSGLLPIVHSFACFLTTRPFEQIYNVSTERTKVIYTGSLAGIIPGGPGHSHQAIIDVALMSSIHNLICVEPVTTRQVADTLRWAVNDNNYSTYIRLASVPLFKRRELENLALPEIGCGNIINSAGNITILVSSPILSIEVLNALDILKESGVLCSIIIMPWLNVLNIEWLRAVLCDTKHLIVYENHSTKNGFGNFVLSKMYENSINIKGNVITKGITGIPICGSQNEVLAYYGIDSISIAETVMAIRENDNL